MLKKAVILGGSSGLGVELSREALGRGISSLALGRSSPAFPELSYNPFSTVDLSDVESVKRCVSWVGLWWDPNCHYFIWNAGILERKPVDDPTLDIDGLINVNFTSAVKIISAVVGRVKSEGRPMHLIAISSTSSWKGRKYEAVYCASKAAQAQFCRALAVELRDDLPGSRVTLVKPAGMKTNLFAGAEGRTMSGFMRPKHVAKIVWDEVLKQRRFFREFQIDRKARKPVLVRENFAPIPFR